MGFAFVGLATLMLDSRYYLLGALSGFQSLIKLIAAHLSLLVFGSPLEYVRGKLTGLNFARADSKY